MFLVAGANLTSTLFYRLGTLQYTEGKKKTNFLLYRLQFALIREQHSTYSIMGAPT